MAHVTLYLRHSLKYRLRHTEIIINSSVFVWLRSWNEDHIAITRWSLCVDIDPHFSGSLVVYFW